MIGLVFFKSSEKEKLEKYYKKIHRGEMVNFKEIIVLLSRLIMQLGGAAAIKRFYNEISILKMEIFLKKYNVA